MLKNKNGFTLIEIMIVVAIIAILAAIAIPNYTKYQMKTKRAEAPENLQAIKMAEEAYRAEKDTYITLIDSPVPYASTGARKNIWVDNGGFTDIGWQPTGDVYGSYLTQSSSSSSIVGRAYTDIDGDGNKARFRFDQSTSVDMTSDNSVY